MSAAVSRKLISGRHWNSGVTSAPRGGFIQSGSRHHIASSKKAMASEGLAMNTMRSGPQAPP